MALIAQAARLVGGKDGGGRIVLQTRLPKHEVVQSSLLADPPRLAAVERERREVLRFPPVTAATCCAPPTSRRCATPSPRRPARAAACGSQSIPRGCEVDHLGDGSVVDDPDVRPRLRDDVPPVDHV